MIETAEMILDVLLVIAAAISFFASFRYETGSADAIHRLTLAVFFMVLVGQ